MDLIDLIDGLIKSSQNKAIPRDPKEFKNWKYCVALAKLGWSSECKKDNSDNLLVIWKKEGKSDIQIKLSFIEQCLWLEYLQKSKEN